MSKSTPGPWQCYADLPSTEPDWHIVTNASRLRVIANVHIEPGNDMDRANACLIAAAPDLLEALVRLREVVTHDCAGFDAAESDRIHMLEHFAPAVLAASDAIAKAEGRS